MFERFCFTASHGVFVIGRVLEGANYVKKGKIYSDSMNIEFQRSATVLRNIRIARDIWSSP